MYLIIDTTADVIANISEKLEETEQGLYSYDEDAFYPTPLFQFIEVDDVPRGVHPYTHKYSAEEGFSRFVSPMELHEMRITAANNARESIKLLDESKGKIAELIDTTDELLLALTDIMGGVE